jgi:oligoribonuclease NrnB/cAMP/cGMP phosphodiesterase (DHH superfamily)
MKWILSFMLADAIGLIPENITIAHGDVDGMASAAIVKRARGDSYVVFSGPRSVSKMLGMIRRKHKIFIVDVAINPSALSEITRKLKRLKEKGSEITWIDHHPWTKEAIETIGRYAEIHVKEEKSAARLVMEILNPEDEVSRKIAEIADDADTAEYSMEISRLYRAGSRGSKLRKRIVDLMAEGKFMDEELEEKLKNSMEKEGKSRTEVNYQFLTTFSGKKFVLIDLRPSGGPGSVIAKELCLKEDFDFALVIFSCEKFSLYRCKGSENLSKVCEEYEGGGHPYACGGRIKMPFYRKILCKILGKGYRPPEIDELIERVRKLNEEASSDNNDKC